MSTPKTSLPTRFVSLLLLSGLLVLCLQLANCGPAPTQERRAEPTKDAGQQKETIAIDEAAPPVATKIETQLSTTAALAGQKVDVTCEVFDQYDKPLAGIETSFRITPKDSVTQTDSSVTIEQLGTYQVTCQSKDQTLTDDTPETLAILPASTANIDTFVSPSQITAGGTATVHCTSEDQFGNPVPFKTTELSISPDGALQHSDGKLTGTKPGVYSIACKMGAKADATPAQLQVIPALPAKLEVAITPQQSHYKAGDLLSLDIKVFDVHGNLIPNPRLQRQVTPSQGIDTNDFPDFAIVTDGNYKLTISVAGPTDGDRKLTKTLSLLADGLGPAIEITSPKRGEMLTGKPDIEIKGRVSDAVSGLKEFSINGQPIVPNQDGTFALVVKSKWGLNMLEMSARDQVGNIGATTQSYLWSPSYQAVDAVRKQAILVRLHQKTFDDGERKSLNDLASILEKVLASLKFNDLIPGTITSGSRGPVRYSVTKRGTATMGARKVNKLQAIKDGFAIDLEFQKVYIPLRGKGSLSVPFVSDPSISKNFSINASKLPLSMQIKLSLANGVINVSVSSINLNANSISVNVFGSWLGFLNGVVTSALRSTLKSKLESAIKSAVPGPIKSFLGGINIGTSIKLPAVVGGKTIKIQTAPDLLAFDPLGGTLGFSMALAIPKGVPDAKLGIPLMEQKAPAWDAKAYGMGVGLSLNLLNQASTNAWFSGALKQDISALVKDNVPPGIPFKPTNLKATVEALLPPLFHKATKGIEVGIGDLLLNLAFDDANLGRIEVTAYLTTMIGATATFDAKQVLSVTIDTTPRLFGVDVQNSKGLGQNAPDLAKFLKGLAPKISTFLSANIVQALPIPTLDLSALGGSLGIPKGTILQIVKGNVSINEDYLTLTGDLQ